MSRKDDEQQGRWVPKHQPSVHHPNAVNACKIEVGILSRTQPNDFHRLFSNAETADEINICLWIATSHIIQQTSTSTYHTQKTSPTSVVLLIDSHMLSQMVDPFRQDRDLNCRRAVIILRSFVLGNCLLLQFFSCRHFALILSLRGLYLRPFLQKTIIL